MLPELISPSQVRETRTLVIQRLRKFADDLDAGDEKAVKQAAKLEISAVELRQAADTLEREAAQDTEMKDYEAAFIPSSPMTCMLQSLLEEQAHDFNLIADEPLTSNLAEGEVPLTSLKLQPGKADVLGLNEASAGLSINDMQDGEDIRYIVDGGLAVGLRLLFGKYQFNPAPAKVAQLGNKARVLLFGDWASGLDRARSLAQQIAKVAVGDDASRVQHLIHLGDTYYAGRGWEYTQRFLPNWPETNGRAATEWSLNGNHDMYSGGKGYFVTLLQHPRFKSHRANPGDPTSASSFFLLENDHWQIFGLDSAYFSPQLTGMNGAIDDSQLNFLKAKLNKDKRVILLTHHQLFASGPGEGNSEQIKTKLTDAQLWPHIDAWIWGHEHRCVIYKTDWSKTTHGLPFGFCLGNSGIPVKDEPKLTNPGIDYEYTESFDFTTTKRLRQFAFASLLFDDAKPEQVDVVVHDWQGRPVKTVTI